MFGGFAPPNWPFVSDETWEYDGAAWKQVAMSGVRPAPRQAHAMVCDARRGRIVMFGGQTFPPAMLGDTWEFDGVGWRQFTGSPAPAARQAYAFVYDPVRGLVVLFGGQTTSSTSSVLHNDTWSYDGATWRKLTPASAPSPRSLPAMAYDSRRNRIVLHGGVAVGVTLNDTWEWDGVDWRLVSLLGPHRAGVSLDYDDSRGIVCLYGGRRSDGTISAETWEFDGTTWHLRAPTGSAPPPLTYHASCYDSARRRLVVFGGWDGITNGIYDDTWEYGPVWQGRYDAYSPACRGGASLDPLLRRESVDPYIGDSFGVRFERILPNTFGFLVIGVSNTSWNGIPLPLDLGWFGMPGCKLASSYEWSVNGWSDANGVLQWGFAIPQAAGLVGARFYNQAFAVDPSAHQRPFVLSNACEGVIGAK